VGLWRFVPLAAFLLFAGLGIGWRSWLQRRRTGSSGIALFRSGRPAQHVRDAALLVLGGIIGAEAVLAAAAPGVLERLGTIAVLRAPVWRPVGLAVVLAGTGLTVLSQLDLGASWRIGIEEGARPGLVTGGLYRFCRNPIYLALLLAVAGLTALLPVWPTAAVLVAAWIGVRVQAAGEEEWLARAYPDEFRAYARRVGRFVPWLGRLR
jgi:protein-S-isoprenylcysteine O-methyltransferase Ste14